MDIGAGAWDPEHRPSEVRLDRLIILEDDAIRREGAAVEPGGLRPRGRGGEALPRRPVNPDRRERPAVGGPWVGWPGPRGGRVQRRWIVVSLALVLGAAVAGVHR